MSAYIIIGKLKILNVKPKSDVKLLPHSSLDFNAFIAISLSKTARFWITENHFLFVGLFDWGNT